MRNIESSKVNDKTVESQLDSKSSRKSQDCSSYYDRMKNGLGIAAAGAWKAAEAALKVTTAGLAIQGVSGLGEAHMLSTSNTSDTAMARTDGGNATALRPAFNQQEFNNLSHPKALEFNPREVALGSLNLLSKAGVRNPKKFIQDTQKQYDHQSIHKREQRQELAKKAQEALKSVSKLFEEKPGKESRETNRPRRGRASHTG